TGRRPATEAVQGGRRQARRPRSDHAAGAPARRRPVGRPPRRKPPAPPPPARSPANLGESTELLCRKLRQSGMAPRVLCELVEVADPEWTGAAEALLGRGRGAVFVDRADIVAATAIFKEGRREFRGASLVSLNKLEQFQT